MSCNACGTCIDKINLAINIKYFFHFITPPYFCSNPSTIIIKNSAIIINMWSILWVYNHVVSIIDLYRQLNPHVDMWSCDSVDPGNYY